MRHQRFHSDGEADFRFLSDVLSWVEDQLSYETDFFFFYQH